MEAARVRDEVASQAPVGEPDETLEPVLAAGVSVPAPKLPPRVTETLICSGQGAALYTWQCPNVNARVALLRQIAQQAAELGELLPLGNFVSALPIVGIAPIMVMWFGFDWPSKAAVVVVITFFPMLVNTLAGLDAAGHIERDLMRSYGARHGQTLRKLYLPAAMPFIFNALKINSTLAFIGAIVAEFFGTPSLGIGFRISIEAGRMALDMVWAEIALAAIAGMAFYGIVALAERVTTFWHPSYRA